MGDRYFPEEVPELREKLDRYLAGLGERLGTSGFAGEVAFLLLAGGYGRGEGGVFVDAAGRKTLYNDLEFYLVLKSRAGWQAAQRWCSEESHAGEDATGIEVEFKILALGELRGADPSMFYYDLLAAHRLVFGDAALVAALPARLRDGSQIPAHEAARLLFNRGSGLFYAGFELAARGAGADLVFVERNHAKARLAFADAVLALNGLYTSSCRDRHERLARPLTHQPANFALLAEWHASAVEFKFHPRHESPPPGVLLECQQTLAAAWSGLFLWLESIRLGRGFRSAQDYVDCPARLFPGFPVVKNIALHLRDRLRRGLPLVSVLDYPRAPLQRALALLVPEHPAQLNQVCRLLALPAGSSPQQIHDAYRRWWRFYN